MEEEEQREGEGEWRGRKGSPKKRGSEWSERAETTYGCGRNGLDMEGDKFSGKAQPR